MVPGGGAGADVCRSLADTPRISLRDRERSLVSNSMATISSGWQVKLTGWPWWAVLLLAIAGVWALVRLHRKEMSALAPRVRQRLLWLRGAALALLILFLMEPSLTRRTTERVLPLAAVVIDQSGSMAVKDGSSRS